MPLSNRTTTAGADMRIITATEDTLSTGVKIKIVHAHKGIVDLGITTEITDEHVFFINPATNQLRRWSLTDAGLAEHKGDSKRNPLYTTYALSPDKVRSIVARIDDSQEKVSHDDNSHRRARDNAFALRGLAHLGPNSRPDLWP